MRFLRSIEVGIPPPEKRKIHEILHRKVKEKCLKGRPRKMGTAGLEIHQTEGSGRNRGAVGRQMEGLGYEVTTCKVELFGKKNINSNCIILISLSDILNYLMERECHKWLPERLFFSAIG